jgi:hypothetical protein
MVPLRHKSDDTGLGYPGLFYLGVGVDWTLAGFWRDGGRGRWPIPVPPAPPVNNVFFPLFVQFRPVPATVLYFFLTLTGEKGDCTLGRVLAGWGRGRRPIPVPPAPPVTCVFLRGNVQKRPVASYPTSASAHTISTLTASNSRFPAQVAHRLSQHCHDRASPHPLRKRRASRPRSPVRGPPRRSAALYRSAGLHRL